MPPHGFPGLLRTHIPGHGRIGHGSTVYHPAVASNPRFTVAHIGQVAPRNFADRRRLLGHGPLYAFVRNRWPYRGLHHHWGWFGPIFWPFAYGDVFYFALWPYDYADYDPFWYYGYDDIYEGIFWPYDYTDKASNVLKAHCPTAVSFTPTGRIAAMQERLEGLVQAASIVQPPVAKFYDALSDEQKTRFNEIGAPSGKKAHGQQTARAAQDPQSECGQNVMAFPTERIDQVVRPDAAQRGKLDALRKANAKAADVIKAACPSTLPVAPPDRLAAEGQRLQSMLTAVETIRLPLDDFYNALSDEQKARFNRFGRQLLARR